MLRTVTLWLLLVLLSVALPAQNSVALLEWAERIPEPRSVLPANLAKSSFELVRNMIYVEAEVDGRLGFFILDTGAPYLIINKKPRPSGDLSAAGCSSNVAVEETTVGSFVWAGRSHRGVSALNLDLSHFERAARRDILGMIGYDQLRDREVLIDYDNRQLFLLPPRSRELHGSRPLAVLPFELAGHLPVIRVRVNNRVLHLGLDTGAAANLLNGEVVSQLSADLLQRLEDQEVQGLDGQVVRTPVYAISGVELSDGEALAPLTFLGSDISHLQTITGSSLDGLLGYPFLSRYTLSISYPEGKLYLWKKSAAVGD